MNPLQLELTKLIGKRELSFGAKIILKDYIWEKTINQMIDWHTFEVCGKIGRAFSMNDVEEIIGHPATLSDFHRWMNEKFSWKYFIQRINLIELHYQWKTKPVFKTNYDSYKDLLSQSEETLKQIVELIKSNQ